MISVIFYLISSQLYAGQTTFSGNIFLIEKTKPKHSLAVVVDGDAAKAVCTTRVPASLKSQWHWCFQNNDQYQLWWTLDDKGFRSLKQGLFEPIWTEFARGPDGWVDVVKSGQNIKINLFGSSIQKIEELGLRKYKSQRNENGYVRQSNELLCKTDNVRGKLLSTCTFSLDGKSFKQYNSKR